MASIPDAFPGKKAGDPVSKQEIINAARLALIAEQEAIALYDRIAEIVPDEKVKGLMTDLSNEEQVHVGELLKLIASFDEDDPEKLIEGVKEAKDKLTAQVVAAFKNSK